MKVVNVFGFDFTFQKNDKIYFVPNDGNPHEIPDECIEDDFLRIFQTVELPRPKVLNELPKPEIIEIKIGNPKKIVKKSLKGVKIKKKKRDSIKKGKSK